MPKISLTIPMEYKALNHAASMLRNMANDLRSVDNEEQGFLDAQHTDLPPIETLQEVLIPGGLTAKHAQPPAPSPSTSPGPTTELLTPSSIVELDSRGFPYDVRIHTKGKNKITKKDGTWKYARNMDPKIIETVEEELRATMNASPDNPITSTPPAPTTEQSTPPAPTTEQSVPPAPTTEQSVPPEPETPTEDVYLVDGKEFTVEQLYASGWTDAQMKQYKVIAITFPEFMAKYTPAIAATTISESMVTSALNRQGLSSLPMLSSRPDLIPAIYKELFGE